jgi:hypothetical protein
MSPKIWRTKDLTTSDLDLVHFALLRGSRWTRLLLVFTRASGLLESPETYDFTIHGAAALVNGIWVFWGLFCIDLQAELL